MNKHLTIMEVLLSASASSKPSQPINNKPIEIDANERIHTDRKAIYLTYLNAAGRGFMCLVLAIFLIRLASCSVTSFISEQERLERERAAISAYMQMSNRG